VDPNAVPGEAGADPNAVPPAAGTDPNAAAAGTDPNVINPNANATGTLGNQIQYFAYTLTIRGTYDSLMNFIGDLSNNAELIEISSISMKNEVGPERVKGKDAGGSDVIQIPGEESEEEDQQSQEKALFDPARPIRLTLKMKLLLIPAPGSSVSIGPTASTGNQASLPIPGGTP
jgi:hypothetical protein